jgi:hypothetical protein
VGPNPINNKRTEQEQQRRFKIAILSPSCSLDFDYSPKRSPFRKVIRRRCRQQKDRGLGSCRVAATPFRKTLRFVISPDKTTFAERTHAA